MNTKTAVLLINLGTPNALNKKSIKSYLREFLSDHRVINLPWLLRFILVNAIIIPFRSSKTLEAYKAIWTADGSPLLTNSRRLQQKLELNLNNNLLHSEQEFDVVLAMRYGEPSIKNALADLQQNNYTRIIIVPLYPQYASASSGSALEKSLKYVSDFGYFPKIICINEFYLLPSYINSLVNSIKKSYFAQQQNHHIIFSYHGIPKKQLAVSKKTNSCCPDSMPCPVKNFPAKCYRAQCYATSRAIAEKLNLSPSQYTTCFQSRLGKLPWIKPYTDETLKTLRNNNISNITVVCPSFVSDCLETLEEIGMGLKDEWLALGGKGFNLIPCLNDSDDWVMALSGLVKDNCH